MLKEVFTRLSAAGVRSVCTLEHDLDRELWVSFQHRGQGVIDASTNATLTPGLRTLGWLPAAHDAPGWRLPSPGPGRWPGVTRRSAPCDRAPGLLLAAG
jgi:hypothetical protein